MAIRVKVTGPGDSQVNGRRTKSVPHLLTHAHSSGRKIRRTMHHEKERTIQLKLESIDALPPWAQDDLCEGLSAVLMALTDIVRPTENRLPGVIVMTRVWTCTHCSDPVPHIVLEGDAPRELVLSAALVGAAAGLDEDDDTGHLLLRESLLDAIDEAGWHEDPTTGDSWLSDADQQILLDKDDDAPGLDCAPWIERWKQAGLPLDSPPDVLVVGTPMDPEPKLLN